MYGYVPPDPESDVSQERYAIIYAPRMKRHRFSANCVTLVDSSSTALELQSESQDMYAAKVLGPSKSSEGQFIYYLVEWLRVSSRR